MIYHGFALVLINHSDQCRDRPLATGDFQAVRGRAANLLRRVGDRAGQSVHQVGRALLDGLGQPSLAVTGSFVVHLLAGLLVEPEAERVAVRVDHHPDVVLRLELRCDSACLDGGRDGCLEVSDSDVEKRPKT